MAVMSRGQGSRMAGRGAVEGWGGEVVAGLDAAADFYLESIRERLSLKQGRDMSGSAF